MGCETISKNIKLIRSDYLKRTSISLTGHRPKELFGYNINSPEYDSIKRRLALILMGFVEGHDEVTCHTGMALGADTIWADIALLRKNKWPGKVKVWAEVPHPNQKDSWKDKTSRDHYDYIMNNVDGSTLYAEEYSPWCMQKRNKGMLDAGAELIAVWSGCLRYKSGTSNAIKYAIKSKPGYFVIRPGDDFVRWDESNPSLMTVKGYNEYSEEVVRDFQASLIKKYEDKGYVLEMIDDCALLSNAVSKVLIETIVEVEYRTETRSYDIFTVKEYVSSGSIFKNINNYTFLSK